MHTVRVVVVVLDDGFVLVGDLADAAEVVVRVEVGAVVGQGCRINTGWRRPGRCPRYGLLRQRWAVRLPGRLGNRGGTEITGSLLLPTLLLKESRVDKPLSGRQPRPDIARASRAADSLSWPFPG